MKIIIDIRALQSGNISGVEMYEESIIRKMCEIFPKDTFYLWTNSTKALPDSFPEFDYENAKRVHTKYSNVYLSMVSCFFRWPKIDSFIAKKAKKLGLLDLNEHFDAVFILDPRPSPVSKKVKKVLLVHDLSPIRYANSFSLKSRIWHKLTRFQKELKESAHILTPSRFTKKDITERCQIPEEKITVIGAGKSEYLRPITDLVELDAVREKYELPQKFLLTLSTLEPRKNLPNLIEAFARFLKRNSVDNYYLVIAGKANPSIFHDVFLPPHPKILFPGFIDEIDKPALFSAASAFIYPSYFEGFGFPLLEAMSCATPVISSNSSSLPEVYGDAAITFDPYSVTEMAQSIETMYFNMTASEELSQKGIERSRQVQFSWKTVAEKAMAELRSSIDQSPDTHE